MNRTRIQACRQEDSILKGDRLSREKAERVTPYGRAESLATRAALARVAKKRTPDTRRDWQANGVPWEVVGPLLLARPDISRLLAGRSQDQEPMAHEQQEALRQITRIFNDRANGDHWDTLKTLLDKWAPPEARATSAQKLT